jgi:membrane-bound lytic murein transglycosylase MltF
MIRIWAVFILILFMTKVDALTPQEQKMLDRAKPYAGVVKEQLALVWPGMPLPSFIAAQIEQESLWNPRAELKTSREYGFGFGQFTITARFNAFEEVKAMHPGLRDWKYEDRFDPNRQILAVIVKDYGLYRQCRPLMATDYERLACVGASYNGGFGGFTSDRRLCGNTQGCDPTLWFGHVERTSMKSRQKWQGYGRSAFEINREYPVNTLRVRRAKYVPLFEMEPK